MMETIHQISLIRRCHVQIHPKEVVRSSTSWSRPVWYWSFLAYSGIVLTTKGNPSGKKSQKQGRMQGLSTKQHCMAYNDIIMGFFHANVAMLFLEVLADCIYASIVPTWHYCPSLGKAGSTVLGCVGLSVSDCVSVSLSTRVFSSCS